MVRTTRSRLSSAVAISVILLLLASCSVAMARAEAASVPTGPLGTNLAEVDYYSGAVPFANLMDQASEWIPQRVGAPWGTGDRLSLRRDRWPARLEPSQFATAVLAEVHYPAGRYSIRWSGKGAFDINGRSFGSVSIAGGSSSMNLDGTSIVLLNIRSTDPTDPIRAIDVRVPGEAAGSTFRSGYLRQLAPYRVLRFMDWQRTNSTAGDPARSFTCLNRTTPASASQGTSLGVSVERMVDLANRLDADPWFTIPHEASLEWVRCHARIVSARLKPGLTARYEFSNETWNPQFRAFAELEAEGVALGLGAGDPFVALQRRHAQRHVAVMTAVREVFVGAGRQVIRVLSGQAANSWVVDERLSTAGAAAATDEIAIAPYLHVHGRDLFDPADAAEVSTWTGSQLMANLRLALTHEVDAWIAAHVSLASTRHLKLITYEAGQHLVGDPSNTALTALLTGTNRAPGMQSLYAEYLQHWRRATGGSLLMHFTDVGAATQWGSWGALETPEQSSSPKYAALVAYSDR